jgi:hypothetical protein
VDTEACAGKVWRNSQKLILCPGVRGWGVEKVSNRGIGYAGGGGAYGEAGTPWK